jgi:hypothetical protein
MNLEDVKLSERSDTKGYEVHNSISMKCPEQANLQGREADG